MFFSKKLLVASASACLLASTATTLQVIVFTPTSQAQSSVIYVPPDNGAPTVSLGGITRSGAVTRIVQSSAGCTTAELACLIGIVPDLLAETAPVPQTIAERPTIYFLTPQVDGIAYFRLFEADISPADNLLNKGKRIYRTSFLIKNEAGIIAFKLPDNAPELKLGKKYIWEFAVGDLTDTEKIGGLLQRIAPSPKLVTQLAKTMKPIDRATLLAQEGIWFDTIQTLAEAKQGTYQNKEVNDAWTSLMKSAKLDRVLTYSFIKTK